MSHMCVFVVDTLLDGNVKDEVNMTHESDCWVPL